MGLLGGAMLAELGKPNASCIVGLELDFPSGTVRWARSAISSETLGTFEARIRGVSGPTRAFSNRGGGVVVPEMSVEIDDTDKVFTSLLGSRERIANSTARLKLLSANVAPVTYYTGRLYDWSRADDGSSWTLNLRPPDVALTQNFVRKTISPSVWTKAADDVRGMIAPIGLGRHDSSGMGTRKGALPTLVVKDDANPFYRMVGWGRWMAVPRVFDGDTLLPTSDYTITYLSAGGTLWTIVSFPTQPTGEVRVDALGYDSVGDGTGTLIDKPTDILKWLAVNLWFQENTSGESFADATAPLDTASFSAIASALTVQAGGQPYRGSAYFDAERTAYEYLEDWIRSTRVDVAWTIDGKLALKQRSPLATGSYVSAPVFHYPGDASEIGIEYAAQDWVQRVLMRYGSQQGGDYIDSEELSDPLISQESAETLELAAGPGFF